MSIVQSCPYDINGEHCKYEIYYGEPIFSKCKNCSRTIFKRVVEMTDEEIADKYAEEYFGKKTELVEVWKLKSCKENFLAGLKAGRPQWHDLQKDKNDLPKGYAENTRFLCSVKGETLFLVRYGSFWQGNFKVDAWCEIPTFDKE